MNSTIQSQIKDLIIKDLERIFTTYIKTKDNVWVYRDKFFLSGRYDDLFREYIKKQKL